MILDKISQIKKKQKKHSYKHTNKQKKKHHTSGITRNCKLLACLKGAIQMAKLSPSPLVLQVQIVFSVIDSMQKKK